MYDYIASPYSHPEPEVMRERFYAAMAFTAWKLKRREAVYSPIVHCHEMAVVEDLPTDFAFWEHYNMQMLVPARALIVLCIDGWEDSVGVKGEIRFAYLLGKPTFYAHPSNILGYSVMAV